jgi:molybdate transport system substrate-binding protein
MKSRMASAVPVGRLGPLGTRIGESSADSLDIFHADSLAGPMKELKKAFAERQRAVTVYLTSGVSKQLAERILKGERCDVFASSSPAVIEDDMMGKRIAAVGAAAASWYVVFSANEMVVITQRGNPLGISRVTDLGRPGTKFVRVTGEKDLATSRTVEFLKKAAAQEGKPEAAQGIIDGAMVDGSKPNPVPDTVRAVTEGRADAAIVYYSAAVAAKNDVAIVRFSADINISDKIRNAATTPGTAQNPGLAIEFVNFLLSPEGQRILQETGQPPVVPPIRKGNVPAAVK